MQRLFLFINCCFMIANSLAVRAQSGTAVASNVPVVIQKAVNATTPKAYKGRQIMVGSGGGITGFSTTYYLLDNGQLFGQRSRDTTFTYIGKQTAVNTNRVFTTVEVNCKIKTTHFDKPGNMYRFARWRKGKLAYKVTWAPGDTTVPANYPKFYEAFMSMIPTASRLK